MLFLVGAVALVLPLVPSMHLGSSVPGTSSVTGTGPVPNPGSPTNSTGGGVSGGDGSGGDGSGGDGGSSGSATVAVSTSHGSLA